MPDPNSIIPFSGPLPLIGTPAPPPPPAHAPAPGHGAAPAPLAFAPGVPEPDFLKHFPFPYKVRAVTIYEAKKHGWATDRSYWEFLEPFRYVSAAWGNIDIPKGSFTDFASVPP